MALRLSKSTKLILLLAIDILFFLVELIVGLSVHSLALVADAFHMFNDILSLLVGLWAIQVATTHEPSRIYTYGWQRAETLGALVNGVFLVALCMSILLEAIQRFAEPQEVSSPILILVVGCNGLASNVLGMVLLQWREEPEPEGLPDQERTNIQTPSPHYRECRRVATLSQISVHPTTLRSDIIAAGQLHRIPANSKHESETQPLLAPPPIVSASEGQAESVDLHRHHIHKQNDGSKTNDKHHDLNMTGVLLHVLGDAVGNIGVIASALFIWLTDFTWRFYADPAVSVLITVVILHSAVPLVVAASRILLEAVPEGINVDEIKQDVIALPGVADCHDLHVSQLSDSNVIATVHIEVDYNVIKDNHEQYLQLAGAIRDCLSAYGISTATIQPEFFASRVERTSASQDTSHAGPA
ncbi:uncharacterized protein PV07_04938 [Cladophialophora immunda]|uniref:Cation diffusion facilitator family transporter n=3 Tax=Cladophialophora immunda TaxID=569365 RepID=A0A0D2CD95_9EURO|nr:uncharacterized protein PV07_04938 [Cladophialophora immunda]KIW29098.1 hypothetical protein PV07_04938 [Cladophialophora immunda]